MNALNASYEGALRTDGKTIAGTLTSGQTTPLILYHATPETAWKLYSSPHTVQMVSVEKGVSLEVLDWGGRGRPLVLAHHLPLPMIATATLATAAMIAAFMELSSIYKQHIPCAVSC